MAKKLEGWNHTLDWYNKNYEKYDFGDIGGLDDDDWVDRDEYFGEEHVDRSYRDPRVDVEIGQVFTNDDDYEFITKTPSYEAIENGIKARENSTTDSSASSDAAMITPEQSYEYSKSQLDKLNDNQKSTLEKWLDDFTAYMSQAQFNGMTKNTFGDFAGGKGSMSTIALADKAQQEKKELEESGMPDVSHDNVDNLQQWKEYQQYVNDYEDRKKQQENLENANGVEIASNSILSDILDPISNVSSFVGSLDRPLDREHLGINVNSSNFALQNLKEDTANQYKKNVDEAVGEGTLGDVLKLAYDAGNAALSSAVSIGIGAGATGALGMTGKAADFVGSAVGTSNFFGAGYSTAMKDGMERGLTEDEAEKLALVSGALEWGTEIIPGAIAQKVFGKVGKALGKEASKDLVKEVGESIAKDLVKEIGAEMGEEVINDIGYTIADNIITGDKSVYNNAVKNYKAQGMSDEDAEKQAKLDWIKDTARDMAVAGVSAGLTMGAAGGVHGIATNHASKGLEGNYQQVAQSIPDNVEDYKDEEAYNKAMEVKQKAEELSEQDNVSGKDRRQLYTDIFNVNDSMKEPTLIDTINEEINNPYTQVGDVSVLKNDITSKEVAKNMTTAPTVETFVEAYRESQASSNKDARSLGQQYFNTLRGKYESFDNPMAVENALKGQSAEGMYNDVLEGKEVQPVTQRQQQAVAKAQQLKTFKDNIGQKQVDAIKLSDEEVKSAKEQITSLQDNSNSWTYDKEGNILNDQGEVVIEKGSNKGTSKFITDALNQPTLSARDLYIESYDASVPVGTYHSAFESAYNAGRRNGTSFKSWLDNHKYYAQSLGEDLVKEFYEEGEKDRGQENSVKEESNKNKPKRTIKKGKGKVTIDKSIKDSKEYKVIKKLSQFAASMGIDVDLVKTDSDKLIATDKQGNIVTDEEGNPIYSKGQFKIESSKIILGVDEKVYQTYFHELTEFIDAYNPEELSVVYDSIMDYVLNQNDKELEEAVGDKIRYFYEEYKKANPNETYNDAAKEVMNNVIYAIFSTEEGTKDFVNYWTNKDQSVLEKVTDFINALIEKLQSLISNAGTDEAKAVYRMAEENAKEIRSNFLDALEGARKNYNEGNVETESDVEYSFNIDKIIKDSEKAEIEKYLRFVENNSNKEFTKSPDGYIIYNNDDSIYLIEGNSKRHTIQGLIDIDVNENDYSYANVILERMLENVEKRNFNRSEFRAIAKIWLKTHYSYSGREADVRIFDGYSDRSYDRIRCDSKGQLSERTLKNTGRNSIRRRHPKTSKFSDATNLLKVDSKGRRLTKGQIERFKNSKIVDEKGNLLVVYHGTPNGDFTVFKYPLNYFTANKDYASKYQEPSASSSGVRKSKTNPTTFEGYLNITNPFDVSNEKNRNIFINEYVKGGYALGINKYASDKEINDYIKDGIDWNEADNLQEFIEEKGYDYDGLILDEGGYFDENGNVVDRGKAYVIFNSNQFKLVSNENPTENEDIRYSLDIDTISSNKDAELEKRTYSDGSIGLFIKLKNTPTLSDKQWAEIFDLMDNKTALPINYHMNGEGLKKAVKDKKVTYFTAEDDKDLYKIADILGLKYVSYDSDGNALTKGQKEKFEDSKVVDKDGNLLVMYHGTHADFNTFKTKEFGIDSSTQMGLGIYTISSKAVANMYGNNIKKVYVNITNPAYTNKKTLTKTKLKKFIKDLCKAEAESLFSEGYYNTLNEALKDTWVSNYTSTYDKTMSQVYDEVAREILSLEDNDANIIQEIMGVTGYSYYSVADKFYKMLKESIGIDGYIDTTWNDPETNENATLAIPFFSNQIKNTDNENPTDSEDIRYSLDIDTTHALDVSPFVDENGNEWLPDKYTISRDAKRTLETILKAAFDTIDYKITRNNVENIADKIIEEYSSDIDRDMVIRNLNIIFDLMQGDYANYQEMTDALMNLSEEIVNKSKVEDETEREMYNNFVDVLNHNTFRLNDNQKAEAENSKDKWGGVFSVLGRYINNNSPYLDSVYQEICDRAEELGFIMDRNASDVDQPLQIMDAIEYLKPSKVKNTFEGADLTDVALATTHTIMQEYFNYGAMEKTSDTEYIKEVEKKLKKEKKNYEKKVKEAYDEKAKAFAKELKAVKEANDFSRKLLEGNLKEAQKGGEYYEQLKQEKANSKWQADEIARLKRQAAIKARYDRNSLVRYKDRQERSHQIAMIRKSGNNLYNMINKPTKTKFVPEMIQKPVLEMLNSIDFINYRNVNPLTINQNDLVNNLIEGYSLEDAYKKAYPYAEGNIRKGLKRKGKGVTDEKVNNIIKKKAQKVLDTPKVKQRYEELTGKTPYKTEQTYPDSQTAKIWKAKMDAVSLMLGEIQNEANYSKYARTNAQRNVLQNLAEVCGQEVKNNLDDFRNSVANEKVPISRLQVDQLKKLNQFLTSLTTTINKANDLFTVGGYADVEELGMQSLDEMSGLKEVKRSSVIRDFFNLKMVQPITFFENLGKATKNLYKAFVNGSDLKFKRVKKAADDFLAKRKELGVAKEIPKWVKELHTYNFNEGELQLTIPQIMYLYAINKREQNLLKTTNGENGYHIQLGGVVAQEVKVELKDKKNYRRQTKAIHLSQSDVDSITDTLSQKQKDLADYMATYLAKECGEWGNNVSRQQYGYNKFNETYYMPYITDKTSTQTTQANAFDEAALRSLPNSSFTKELTPKADTPIILSDIFDVFANHIEKMASFEGFALPINDSLRFLNFNAVHRDEKTGKRYDNSIKGAFNRVLGNEAENYFKRFIVDINGDSGQASDLKGIDKLLSYNKAQAVMANSRVVFQQPVAIIKAMEVIDNKYILKGLAMTPAQIKKYYQKSQEKSGLAWLKGQGYFDTNIGQSFKKLITGISTFRENVNEVAGFLAGAADNLTWGALYHATELKVKDDAKKNNEKLSEEEFDNRVLDLFNEIIVKTQVVDATITKSQLMRSKDTGTKLLTTFAAEPTTFYNMFYRGLWDRIQTGNNKKLAKNSLIILYSGLILSAVTTLIDAWRDDEDKEKEWEDRLLDAWISKDQFEQADSLFDYTKALFSSDLFDAMSPLNWLPIVREFGNAFQGYEAQNMALSGIYQVADLVKTYDEVANGETKLEWYGIANKTAKAVSMLTGVPFATALREIKDLYNNVNNLWDGDNIVKRESTTNPVVKAIDKGENISEVAQEQKQTKLQEALDKGKSQKEAESSAKSSVEKSITSKYRDQLIELKDSDINKANELKQKLIEAYVAIGYDRKSANEKINKWFK